MFLPGDWVGWRPVTGGDAAPGGPPVGARGRSKLQVVGGVGRGMPAQLNVAAAVCAAGLD